MNQLGFRVFWFYAIVFLSQRAFTQYSWLQMHSNGSYIVRCVQDKNNTYNPQFSYSQSQKGKIETEKMRLRFDGSKDLEIDDKVNKALFPIKVYEGRFKAHQGSTVSVQCGHSKSQKISWTIPNFESLSIPDFVIFGDSGCNPKKFQHCPLAAKSFQKNKAGKTLTTWEFPKLVDHALHNFPSTSFFIHVGDYVYQGGYGFKDGVSKTANWREWEADFFAPMEAMLKKMPGLFIRGNHETFGSNSGLGWFILFDSYKFKKLQPFKNLKNKGNREILTKPWHTSLSKNVEIVIWDNSVTNLYGAPYATKKMVTERMKDYLKEASNNFKTILEETGKKFWLAAHVPLFGLNEDGDKFIDPEQDGPDDFENIVYQTNFDNYLNQRTFSDIGTRQGWLRMLDKKTQGKFFAPFSYFIAGDIHTMQEVRPLNKKGMPSYPVQVICGGSGVKLDKLAECINLKEKPCREAQFNQVTDFAFKQEKDLGKGHWGMSIPVKGRGIKAVGYITHHTKKDGSHDFTIQQIITKERPHKP